MRYLIYYLILKVNTKTYHKKHRAEMKHLIKFYHESGVTDVMNCTPCNRLQHNISQSRSDKLFDTAVTTTTINTSISYNKETSIYDHTDKCSTLEELYEAINKFEGCALKDTATNTVIKDGSSNAKIMLIGEAPGRNEDIMGIPFCGQSGKLLDIIMESAGYKRQDLYITNTVFWRPPANRRPTSEEIQICRPFVEKHIALIKPQVILLVGSTAAESLLDSKAPMHLLRQKQFNYSNRYLAGNNIPLFVIFHPSYLLRQPTKKKEMWQDIQYIKKTIDF